MKDLEGKITENDSYITFLESGFSKSTTRVMSLKMQLKTTDLKTQLTKGRATIAKEKATTVELVA